MKNSGGVLLRIDRNTPGFFPRFPICTKITWYSLHLPPANPLASAHTKISFKIARSPFPRYFHHESTRHI
jgi:hypothetical protein